MIYSKLKSIVVWRCLLFIKIQTEAKMMDVKFRGKEFVSMMTGFGLPELHLIILLKYWFDYCCKVIIF